MKNTQENTATYPVSRRKYDLPRIDVMEVIVENGFASSAEAPNYSNPTLPDYGYGEF